MNSQGETWALHPQLKLTGRNLGRNFTVTNRAPNKNEMAQDLTFENMTLFRGKSIFAKTFPTSLQVKASIPCKNSDTNSSSSTMISHSWLNIFHDRDDASMSLSSNERDRSISLTNKKPPKFPPLKKWHEETWLLLFSKLKEENKQTHYLLRLPCKPTSSNFVTKSSADRISDILTSNLPCCNNNTNKTWEWGSLLPTMEEGREEVNYTFLSRRGGVCSTYVYLLQYHCGFC